MHRLVVVWMALLVIATGAQGGSAEDPEITDATGDSVDDIKDIVKVWIEDGVVIDSEGRESLLVAVELVVDDPDLTSLFVLHERIRIGFKAGYPGAPEAHEAYVIAQPNLGTTSETGQDRFICRFGLATEEGGSQDITEEQDMDEGVWDGSHFECLLPLDYIGGSAAYGQSLTDIWAVYQVVQRGPTNGGDAAGVRTHDLDRAPDSGFGRDYTIFAPAPPAPDVSYETVEILPYSNSTDTPLNGTFVFNHTGAGPFLIEATATAGSLGVEVSGPDGTVFNDNGTAINAEVEGCATACNMSFQFTFDGFVGNYSIDIAPPPSALDGNGTSSDGGSGDGGAGDGGAAGDGTDAADGNATADNSTQGPASKESPAWAIPMAVLVVVAIAMARRR